MRREGELSLRGLGRKLGGGGGGEKKMYYFFALYVCAEWDNSSAGDRYRPDTVRGLFTAGKGPTAKRTPPPHT